MLISWSLELVPSAQLWAYSLPGISGAQALSWLFGPNEEKGTFIGGVRGVRLMETGGVSRPGAKTTAHTLFKGGSGRCSSPLLRAYRIPKAIGVCIIEKE